MEEPESNADTFEALITEYLASSEWGRLGQTTKISYKGALNRIRDMAGERRVRDMQRRDVYALQDALAATPAMANKMLTVLKVLIEWAVRRGYREDNPVINVRPFKAPVDSGTKPWPEDAFAYIMKYAPEHVRRLVYLGRATGQRQSDLLKMAPAHLVDDGIHVKIQKLRGKPHFVPLGRTQMEEIRSWAVADYMKTTGASDTIDLEKARSCGLASQAPFIRTATGGKYSPNYFRAIWDRWLDQQDALSHMELKLHGLRATAVADRRLAGVPDNMIAAELGMSVAMVSRYSRHAGTEKLARASRDKREGAARKARA